jgi:hypothetical protein
MSGNCAPQPPPNGPLWAKSLPTTPDSQGLADRVDQTRGLRKGLAMPRLWKSWAAVAAALTTSAALSGGALAAMPVTFPTSRTLVPIAVAAAFAMPALVAALFVALAGLARRLGPLLGTVAAGAAAVMVVLLIHRGLPTSFGG